MKAWYKPYKLQFKSPVLTSRGSMSVKNGYYLYISDGKYTGIGECSYIEGLSNDDFNNYEQALMDLCDGIEASDASKMPDLNRFPSISFGFETAMIDLHNGGERILFDTEFTHGIAAIPINGLVWMGDKDFMLQQIEQKLQEGFSCIKIKVGAIDFEEEVKLLAYIRERYTPEQIEIRLDANGAFGKRDALLKLERLSKFNIHSIEQPIKPKQWELMHTLSSEQIIPIALDEELIGIKVADIDELLTFIHPQYIILKPSLLGGLNVCDEWIKKSTNLNIGWWATSALESNIGLNAIAQWAFTHSQHVVQGLGTGSLYTNNIPSPLVVQNGTLRYDPNARWSV